MSTWPVGLPGTMLACAAAPLAAAIIAIGFILVRVVLRHLLDLLGMLWFAPHENIALAGALVTGLGCALVFPALGVEALERVPPANRGSAMGAFVAFPDIACGVAGPSTGLGLMAAELLRQQGHQVVLHARNAERAEEARAALPKAEAIVVGDLGTIDGAKAVAARVNTLCTLRRDRSQRSGGLPRKPADHLGWPAARLRHRYPVCVHPDGTDQHAQLRHTPTNDIRRS